MARPPRADEAGAIYHALNRGNVRGTVFHKDEDFEAFERIVGEGRQRYAVELFAYQWMPNHWHMVLRPLEDGAGNGEARPRSLAGPLALHEGSVQRFFGGGCGGIGTLAEVGAQRERVPRRRIFVGLSDDPVAVAVGAG